MKQNLEHIKWFRLNWIRYDDAHSLALAFCHHFNTFEDFERSSIPDWVEDMALEYMERKF